MQNFKGLASKLTIKGAIADEEEYEQVLVLSAQDEITTGRRTIDMIMAFELAMLVYSFTVCYWRPQTIYYVFGYIFLLIASIVGRLYISYIAKNISNRYKKTRPLQYVYCSTVVLWAIYMTVVDNIYNPSFSCLIIVTIMVILPVVGFLDPIEYVVLHFAGFVSTLFVIIYLTDAGQFGNIVNFSVFTIISFISGMSYFGIRFNSYRRRIKLANMAHFDGLSGLYNRQMLRSMTKEIWKDCVDHSTPLSCVLFDIDDFKRINDNYGHLTGDNWIVAFSEILKTSGDAQTQCFRYGGEEFLVLLPGCEQGEAISMTQKIQKKLKEKSGECSENPMVTVSAGIYTGYPEDINGNFEHYFSRADALLYNAKKAGKNQYCARIAGQTNYVYTSEDGVL